MSGLVRRAAVHYFSGMVLVGALVLAYLFGAAHGFEAGYYGGYDRGLAEGQAAIPAAEYNALVRGYWAGAQAGAQAAQARERYHYYRAVYGTCMSVNWELFYMPLQKRIAACGRGVAWAQREGWYETWQPEGFNWPPGEESAALVLRTGR